MISRSRPGPRLPPMDTTDTTKRRIHPGLLLGVLLIGPFMAQADATMARLDECPAERAETQILRSLAHAYLGEYPAALADLDEAEAALTGLHVAPFLGSLPLRRAQIFWAEGDARRCFGAARKSGSPEIAQCREGCPEGRAYSPACNLRPMGNSSGALDFTSR